MLVSLESNTVSLERNYLWSATFICILLFKFSGHYIQACWSSYCNRYNKGFQQRCYQVRLVTQVLLYIPSSEGLFGFPVAVLLSSLSWSLLKSWTAVFLVFYSLVNTSVCVCVCLYIYIYIYIFFFFPWLLRCLDSVPQTAIEYFKESARLLVQEKGPINALAAALAHISGATSIEQRSLLNSDVVRVYGLTVFLNLEKTNIPLCSLNGRLFVSLWFCLWELYLSH